MPINTIYAVWLSSSYLIKTRFRERQIKIVTVGKLSFRMWRRKYEYVLRALYATYLDDHKFTLSESRRGKIMEYKIFCKKIYLSPFKNSKNIGRLQKAYVNPEIEEKRERIYNHICE